MAFIRNKKQKTENILKQEKQEIKKLRKKQRSRDKNLKLCRKAVFSVACTRYFWFLFFVLDMGGIYFGYSKNFFKFSNPSTKPIASFTIALIFAVIAICRLVSSFGFNKQLNLKQNGRLKSMPEDSSPFIRELYVILGEKRCAHFWITFTLIFMSILNFLYVITVAGILKATGNSLNFWKLETWKFLSEEKFWEKIELKIDSWDWSQFLTFFSVVFFVLLLIQYWIVSFRHRRFMSAIEEIYGKEKMVDECTYFYRVHKIHKRYKSISFIVLCVLGTLFYIFFKKIICIIFDKSFSI